MKKYLLSLVAVLVCNSFVLAQKQDIDKNFSSEFANSLFTTLASDLMMGRDPVRPEMKLAYTVIAQALEIGGAKPLPGANGYYQDIPFTLSSPPTRGSVQIGEFSFSQGQNLLVLDGRSFRGNYEVVDIGFGSVEEFAGKDLKGKILITNVGAPNKFSPNQLFSEGRAKALRAKEAGAVALIERFNVPSVPWQLVSGFLNRSQLGLDQGEASNLPYLWVEDLKNQLTGTNLGRAKVEVEGKVTTKVDGKNVLGVIEGTDPVLKNEYILLSAHYDHVGVGAPDETGDSIYNGARDNAVGTVAVLNAAQYFGKNPPKRSIIFALWTAEDWIR